MSPDRKGSPGDQAFRLTLLVIAVVASMSLVQEVLKPLGLAVLLAFILAPLARFLEGRGMPRVPAVAIAVASSLVVLASIGYAVGSQLVALANDLPRYQAQIDRKIGSLTPARENALSRAAGVFRHVAEVLGPAGDRGVPEVRLVAESGGWERLENDAGPYLGLLGVGSIVLILVLFLLLQREEMSDRIVRLFGRRRIGLTTRTIDEAGRRISRYLAAFTAVNSAYGLIIGLGLWAIGVPMPALWGALAAALRFIPYVGPATAFILPLLLSAVVSTGWREPILVVALFGVLEVAATSILEPILYGKTSGVSAIGLLVAAMFWSWLWGPVGLLLSTPLTVCLAVVGKSVPGLGFFATLLGEEPALEDSLRLYQRLLAVDRPGARAILEAALAGGTIEVACDAILIPVLAKAEVDFARKEIDAEDRDLIWRTVDDFLDDWEWKAGLSPRLIVPGFVEGAGPTPAGAILGIAVRDTADVLALRMLNLALAPWGRGLEILLGPGPSPRNLVALAAERSPTLLVLSHLPPVGLAATRRLARLIRERSPDLPVVVALWGGTEAEDAGRVVGEGTFAVVGGIAEARDRVLTAVLRADEAAGLLGRSLLAADLGRAGHLLDRMLRDRPIESVCADLIQPVLASIAGGDARREAARFFRSRLLPAVNGLRKPAVGARRALVACPGGDARDVGSMMLTLLLRGRGWDVLDLGNEVPPGRIGEIAGTFRPHLVVLFSADRAGPAGDLISAATTLAGGRQAPPAVAFSGEAFSGEGAPAGLPGPVLPEAIEARLATIDRIVAGFPDSW